MLHRNRTFTRRRRRCEIEALEARLVLSSFTVMNTGDSGSGSLRQAILDANAAMGSNTIDFAASFSMSPHTITFTTPTPQINGQLTITGPGASLLTVTRTGNVTASSNVFNSFATSLTMSGITVTGGNINGNGGGLSISGINPNITLDSMVFTSNNANGNGGGISLNNNAALTVRNSTMSNNTATALGGAISFFQGGSLVMQNCTVSGNTASGTSGHDASGGAIYFDGTALASPPPGYTASTLLVRGSTFNGNTASHAGGAIAVDEFTGTLLLQDSTLTANIAGTSGGGVLCIGNSAGIGSMTLQDCTVAGNRANGTAGGTGGGGVARLSNFAGSINLTGTIVFGNNNPGGVAPDVFASSSFTTTNANFCDIGSATGFTLSGSSGNNLPFGSNPMLGALASNGGSTQTMALLVNSPAINTGTSIGGITTDQRGIARPQGSTPDIGAYERQATAASLTSMSYDYMTRQAVTFNFSDDASVTFSRSSYTIVNRTTNQTLASSTGTSSFNAAGTQYTLVLTNLLADGNYRVSSGASTLDFFVLSGDANHDRTVDTVDFNILASNFSQSGKTFGQGDFNYDGTVDTIDFNLLAANFGKILAASATATRTPAMPFATTRIFQSPEEDLISILEDGGKAIASDS